MHAMDPIDPMTPDDPAVLISPRALATRWGISQGHLSNQRTKGTGLPFYKFGSAVRYRMADVLALEAGERPEVATLHKPVSR